MVKIPMPSLPIPWPVPNRIDGRNVAAAGGAVFAKPDPCTGEKLGDVARSTKPDVESAVAAARRAFASWSEMPAVKRASVLYAIGELVHRHREMLAAIVARETGKPMRLALGEADGTVALIRFMAGEGQRLYGRTTTSEVSGRHVMSFRAPVGVAALVVPANTPAPNAAWKIFPALIAGNAVVVKASEDAPGTAWWLAQMAEEAGLPPGVLNVVQGLGAEAGEALVTHPDVGLVSFTGSTEVGKRIAAACADRVVRLSLELGGKNPFIVCADADIDGAVHWAVLSAFSNSGQRCAAASRILVSAAIYDRFRDAFVEATSRLRLGAHDEADLGPLLRESQLERCLASIRTAQEEGATVLLGGRRADGDLRRGFFMHPTILEGVSPKSEVSRRELFGPVTCLYRFDSDEAALDLANDCPYGLTAAVHTRSVDRALWFVPRLQAGLVAINAGTYGSEPHLPFGGVKASGNGTREPGTEAIDFYTSLKTVTITVDPKRVPR